MTFVLGTNCLAKGGGAIVQGPIVRGAIVQVGNSPVPEIFCNLVLIHHWKNI